MGRRRSRFLRGLVGWGLLCGACDANLRADDDASGNETDTSAVDANVDASGIGNTDASTVDADADASEIDARAEPGAEDASVVDAGPEQADADASSADASNADASNADGGQPCPASTLACLGTCRNGFEACGRCDHSCQALLDSVPGGGSLSWPAGETRACLAGRCYFVATSWNRMSCAQFCGSMGMACTPVRGRAGIVGAAYYYFGQANITQCGTAPDAWNWSANVGYEFSRMECACQEHS